MISSLHAFDKVLETYDPDLLVISGLQMMDNYPFREGNSPKCVSDFAKLNYKIMD